jgi:signal transduction histidine kinase
MTRLVDDLLDISRITRGRITLQRERVSLGLVLANAVESSRPLMEAAGHDLTLDLPAESLFLDGDPTRLTQVFGNLLVNAAKYTERAGHVLLAAERLGSDVRCRSVRTASGRRARQTGAASWWPTTTWTRRRASP